MRLGQIAASLEKYLPENCAEEVARLLLLYPVKFKIVKPRKTKLGDFRVEHGKYTITVNGDLNPYEFLITTIHEIAHLETYVAYGRKVKPHGEEWKLSFTNLLFPFYQNQVFPKPIEEALSRYLTNPKASSCADQNLVKALRLYSDKKSLLVEDLQEGETFQLNNFTFVRGKKARTRYKCKEVNSGRFYMVNGIAEIIKE